MYIVDAKGTLVYAGGIDDKPTPDPADIAGARNHVLAALGEIKAGKPVSVPTSRPYGCSVKYPTANPAPRRLALPGLLAADPGLQHPRLPDFARVWP